MFREKATRLPAAARFCPVGPQRRVSPPHPAACNHTTRLIYNNITSAEMEVSNFIYPKRESALQLGDYTTYRTQLSQQLANSRKRLGRSTPKNAKFQKKAAITAEDIGGNSECVLMSRLSILQPNFYFSKIRAPHSTHIGKSMGSCHVYQSGTR